MAARQRVCDMERMDDKELAPFGQRLARLMERAGVKSKKALMKQIGISPMTLHRYEHEVREPPASVLVAMATALECSTDELLGLEPRRWKLPAGAPIGEVSEDFERLSELGEAVRAASERAVFPRAEVIEFVDALERLPLLSRAARLKSQAMAFPRSIPSSGPVAEVPDLTVDELHQHVQAGSRALLLVAEVQSVCCALLAAVPDMHESLRDQLEARLRAVLADVDEGRRGRAPSDTQTP